MKIPSKRIRVGIVGGGPAGAFCALLLSRAGFSVILFERCQKVQRKVCGEYLVPAANKLFEQAGLPHFLSNRFPALEGILFHLPGGLEILSEFPSIEGQKSVGFALDRVVLEEDLLKLCRKSGAEIRMGSTVKSIKKEKNGWSIFLENEKKEKVDLLIGADGRHSVVSKNLNFHLDVKAPRVALHSFLPGKLPDSRHGLIHIFEDGAYFGLNTSPSGYINLSLICSLATLKKFGKPKAVLAHYLKQSGKLAKSLKFKNSTPIHTTYPLNHSVLKCAGSRVALIGDAAGIIDPLTGEGIYMALWSATCLAEQLSGLTKNNFETKIEECLQNYAELRKNTFLWKSRFSNFFQWAIQRPYIVRTIGKFMQTDSRRADAFIGMMGHLYSPFEGLKKILWGF